MRSPDDILDELLVLRARAGDESAVAALAERWSARFLLHARRLTGDAEAGREAAQEGWLAILRGLHRLDDPARFRSWAYRIVTHKARDFVRRRTRRRDFDRRFSREPRELASPSAETWALDDENRAALSRALRRLDEERVALLSLYYRDGLSVREIARALDLPEGTVKSRLFHTRRALATILGASQDDREEKPR